MPVQFELEKNDGDAFENTNLEAAVSRFGVEKRFVFCAQTDACIHSAIHGASARGYDVALDVVQQLMNTYFDRRLSIDLKWDYHPLATSIKKSGLRADFQKKFGEDLAIQAEIQFGNMSRWYSDVFKFQAAYSQSLVNVGLSVIPMGKLARRIDSNIVQFERAKRELPSAELSITLPIMIVGLEPDSDTEVVDVSKSKFASIKEITGKGKAANKWL